jgi:hypothetical protein
MIKAIESGREQAIALISDDSYLAKLQEEFDCSSEEAKKHQQTRLSNISITNYMIKSLRDVEIIFSKENPDETEFQTLAYDTKYDNLIYFAYDADYQGLFSEVCLHEFLHKATRRNLGLSPKAIKLLSESFNPDENFKEIRNQYHSVPTERYVRLKILEQEMEKLEIKKVGEKFRRKHFDQLYKLYSESKLKYGSLEFMHFTDLPNKEKYKSNDQYLDDLYKLYKTLFNEIAEVKDKRDTYQHPDWDYNSEEEQV